MTVPPNATFDQVDRDDDQPPAILCNEIGSFPWSVLSQRHPALIAQTRAAFPYPPLIELALEELLQEILGGPVTPLPDDEHDAADWLATGAEVFGRPWFDAPFLWAESYFYRRLLHAVDFFHEGPWLGVDPFGPVKRHELASDGIDAELNNLDEMSKLSADERLAAYSRASLWGNLADLGFHMSDPDAKGRDRVDDLIVDQTPELWRHVRAAAPARIGFITDNAAAELLHDLVLIDQLLEQGLASDVTLHVKRYPYFVSDATSEDVVDCLTRLRNGPAASQAIAERLFQAYSQERLRVDEAGVFVAPISFHDLDRRYPSALATALAGADLVIAKGDLNYRRLAGDRHWRGDEPFGEVIDYFPVSVAVLRTVKSEVAIGVDQSTLDALDTSDPGWRGNGRHAMIQVRLPAAVVTE